MVRRTTKTVAPQGNRCPFCGKERPRQRVSECYYCHKPITDEYILLIDEAGDRFGFCSAKCMDLLFDYMEAEEYEEEE